MSNVPVSPAQVTGIRFANTTRSSYAYDNAGRLLRLANLSATSTTLSSFAYKLDAVGNRTRVVEASGDRVTWSYDATYQLKNERRVKGVRNRSREEREQKSKRGQ